MTQITNYQPQITNPCLDIEVRSNLVWVSVVGSALAKIPGVKLVKYTNPLNDDSWFWDAAERFQLSFTEKVDLLVSFSRLRDKVVCIQQVQCARERGNRWLYKLHTDPRSLIVQAIAKALPEYLIATPNGEQKVRQISAQHGGFTVEQLEAMNWEEWEDGRQVVPRLLRQYGRCPDGYRWGEAIGDKTTLLVPLAPGLHQDRELLAR